MSLTAAQKLLRVKTSGGCRYPQRTPICCRRNTVCDNTRHFKSIRYGPCFVANDLHLDGMVRRLQGACLTMSKILVARAIAALMQVRDEQDILDAERVLDLQARLDALTAEHEALLILLVRNYCTRAGMHGFTVISSYASPV